MVFYFVVFTSPMSVCSKIPVVFSTVGQPPASLRKQKMKRKFISDKRTLNTLCGLERNLKGSGNHELLAIRKGDYNISLFKKTWCEFKSAKPFRGVGVTALEKHFASVYGLISWLLKRWSWIVLDGSFWAFTLWN